MASKTTGGRPFRHNRQDIRGTHSREKHPHHVLRHFEIEVVHGLEEWAAREVQASLRVPAHGLRTSAPGRLWLSSYHGPLERLNRLRTVTAVYGVLSFTGTRPSVLLGQEPFGHVLGTIVRIRPLIAGARTLRVSAAGFETPTFIRLTAALCRTLGLQATRGPADLELRVRRPPDGAPGWQVLVRLSRRPLTARPWRVCHLPGALDASIARVMGVLAGVAPGHRVLNLTCGSGTLLVERLLSASAAMAIGVDHDPAALACARTNLKTAGLEGQVSLLCGDAGQLPLTNAVMDEIVADLPFGMVVGTPASNERLYPALLAEAARVATPRARLVVITASRRLLERAASGVGEWRLRCRIPLRMSTNTRLITPNIYVFDRTA
ncbi:MAG TPA: methyltransferase domain-containing protein [Chloroflexota bacterium]|nr:methyltransferase domain-containing protein [Chloroflexota bacterium]